MTSRETELIREKLPIVEFLRGYLTLQQAGKNFKALCPFHKEKTPSFMISPDRQTWHCFGCNTGGDVFSFLMRYENLEFSEALKVLAEKAGIELKYANSADYKFFGLLYELNQAANEFYIKELGRSEAAAQYLKKRGLVRETIEEFELGFAPQNSDSLMLYLIDRGYNSDDILRAGLSFKTERGLHLDRFRGRIMFPIHNHFGKVVGFTGRILPQYETGEMGKYVNSPETPIFSKSKFLYGLWRAKNSIREAQSAFLVEGQMDFLMSWQAGIKHAVATSGTALTGDHLKILRRLTDQLIVSFDSDEAGYAAGERAIDLAEAHDFSVKVLITTDFKDPAEAIEKDPQTFRASLAGAVAAPEFYIERYLKKFTGGALPAVRREPDFKKNLRTVLGKIKNMASAVQRSIWVKELGRRIGIEEKVLEEEMSVIGEISSAPRGTDKKSDPLASSKNELSRREFLSQHLLTAALASDALNVAEASMPYLAEEYREILKVLRRGERNINDQRLDQLLNLIVLKAGVTQGEDIQTIQRFLIEEHKKEERQILAAAIKSAEAVGDETSARSALEKFHHQLYTPKET